MKKGCTCQNCKNKYTIDLIIDDNLWIEKISPKKSSGGMLCPACIINEIGKLYKDKYMAFKLEVI